ncbi:hypothetical protein F3Y22_tig00110814pilonHSYRG00030 [Hibiscus syriacus]|uniref:Uncharacterized protein n=1 Tax=Hibiscus syriacus TaxID=106335 RepID=A0A6A2ZPG6_HIBSY|nr:hypothetical protein F3Y22_tig00110814pilonHSYRG00030 [Hibiscus syriacus]
MEPPGNNQTVPKVKIFAWKVCHDAIPTGAKLSSNGIGNGVCSPCKQGRETSLDALKDCCMWMENAALILQPDKFVQFLLLIWNMWNRRNKWIHEGVLQSARGVIDFAWLYGTDFLKVASETDLPSQTRTLTTDGLARRLHGSFTAEIVEAIALSSGIEMAHENGWSAVDVKSDSFAVINKLHSPNLDLSVAGYRSSTLELF